jgi:hypothetical protein
MMSVFGFKTVPVRWKMVTQARETLVDKKGEIHKLPSSPTITPREYRDRLRREALERIYTKLKDVTDGPSFLFSDNFKQLRRMMQEVESPDWIGDIMRKISGGGYSAVCTTPALVMELDPPNPTAELPDELDDPDFWDTVEIGTDEEQKLEVLPKVGKKKEKLVKLWQKLRGFFQRRPPQQPLPED